MRGNQLQEYLGVASRVMSTLTTEVLRAVTFMVLFGLLVIYTGNASQQGDTGEDLFPLELASYSPVELDVGQPWFVTAGDIDGDGYIDLVLLSGDMFMVEHEYILRTWAYFVKVDWSTGGVTHTRLLLEHMGRMGPPVEILAPFATITDFDGDGHCDVVLFDNGRRAFVVLRGDGHGSFSEEHVIVPGRHGFVSHFVVADVDGDGYTDLVLADHLLGSVRILWGEGQVKSARSSVYTFPAGHNAANVVTGDFTGDGRLEVAVLGIRTNEIGPIYFVAVFSLDESWQLNLLSITEIGEPDPVVVGVPLALGDYNRDGHLDLLTARSEHGYVLLGRGDGTFVVEEVYWLLGEKAVSQIILADLDADGCLNDIVVGVGSGRVWIMTGCYGGDGLGLVVPVFPVFGWPVSVTVADVNRDGTLDVIVASNPGRGSTYLTVLLGTREGQ